MLKIFYCIFLSLYLTACSSLLEVTKLPEQKDASRLFKVEQLNERKEIQQTTLLTVQFEPKQWRWVQTDPLGAPVARMILAGQGWQNDGFVMPNNQAKQLFSALATALNPTEPPFKFSQVENTLEGRAYKLKSKTLWKIQQQHGQYHIALADKSLWRIEELID
ncbi:MAG TPA: hypothetical protein DD638_02580 [Pasteurellaceae bacterium]|nr:hypothetical protein [Pasteurellaceae bacterium]